RVALANVDVRFAPVRVPAVVRGSVAVVPPVLARIDGAGAVFTARRSVSHRADAAATPTVVGVVREIPLAVVARPVAVTEAVRTHGGPARAAATERRLAVVERAHLRAAAA